MDFNDDDLEAWWDPRETYEDVIHQASHLYGYSSTNCGWFWESSDSDDEIDTRLEDFLENLSNASNDSDGELRFEDSGFVVDINNNTHWTANLDISINNVENNSNTDARVEHDDSGNNYNEHISNETDEDTNTIIQDIIEDIIQDIDTENTNNKVKEIEEKKEDKDDWCPLSNFDEFEEFSADDHVYECNENCDELSWELEWDDDGHQEDFADQLEKEKMKIEITKNGIILNKLDEDTITIVQNIIEDIIQDIDTENTNDDIILNKTDEDTLSIIEDIIQDIDTENTNDDIILNKTDEDTITVIQDIIEDNATEPSVDKECDSGYEGPPNKMLKLMTGENLETESKPSALCSMERVKGTGTNDLGNEPISRRTRSGYKINEIANASDNEDHLDDSPKLSNAEMDDINTENGPISARTRSKRKLRDVRIEELLLSDDFIAKNKDSIKMENEDYSNNGPANKYSKLVLENK